MISYLMSFLLILLSVRAYDKDSSHNITSIGCFDDIDCNNNGYCYNGQCVLLTKSDDSILNIVLGVGFFICFFGLICYCKCRGSCRNTGYAQSGNVNSYHHQYDSYHHNHHQHHKHHDDPHIHGFLDPDVDHEHNYSFENNDMPTGDFGGGDFGGNDGGGDFGGGDYGGGDCGGGDCGGGDY